MLHSPFTFKHTVKISVFSLVLFSDSFSWKFWPQQATSENTIIFFVCPLKFCISIVFSFLLGNRVVSRENKNNAHAKFGVQAKSIMVFSEVAYQVVTMSHLLFLFMGDLTLKKGKKKSSSYGLLTDVALQVECLAPGHNCITCTKGKSRRNIDSEKSEPQMEFEPTTLRDIVGCSNH